MKKPHYVILGAGISGLALGFFLKQHYHHNIDLSILEASERTGGWIQTEIKDDFFFEQGPRSFRPHGSGIATLQLIESLGLQEEVIFAHPDAHKRYLYMNHDLHKLPTGPLSLFFSSYMPKLLNAIWKDCYSPKSNLDDESIYSFVKRRFGESIAELFFDPLISGIYAGDIKILSIKSCFPWLYQMEQKYRCICRGALVEKNKTKPNLLCSPFVENSSNKGIFTLKRGVQSLTDKLSEILKNEIYLKSRVQRISCANGISTLELQSGKIVADKLFITIPPHQLSCLFEANSLLKKNLESIPASSLAVINFGYRTSVLKYSGFGYLVPSQAKQKLLGVIWDSSAFPQQNKNSQQTRLTAMLGGSHHPGLDACSDSTLIEIALKELHAHIKINSIPDHIHIKRARNAIPQYTVGHQARLRDIEDELKKMPAKINLLGNGFYGISVNDCIAQAMLRTILDKGDSA